MLCNLVYIVVLSIGLSVVVNVLMENERFLNRPMVVNVQNIKFFT